MQRWSRQTRSRLVWLGLAFVLPGVTGQGFLTGGARGQAGPATTARAAPFPDAAQRIARRAVAYSRGIPSTPAPEPAGGLGQAVFPAGEYPVTLPAVSLLGARNDLPNPYQPGVDWGEQPARRTWGSTASVTTAPDGTIWVIDRCGNSGAGGTTCGGASASANPIFQFEPSGKLLKTFGAGLFVSPHKLTIDDAGNRPSGIFNSQGPNSQSGELECGELSVGSFTTRATRS